MDLSPKDRNRFSDHPLQVYDLEEADYKEILQLFLLVNRKGTPVDVDHITFVENQLKELMLDS